MFGTQSMRLLRTKWKTPTLLAQELFAMFQSDIPLQHSGGLKLDSKGGAAPLELTRGDFGDGPVINFGPGGNDGNISFAAGRMVIEGSDIVFRTDAGDTPVSKIGEKDKDQPKAQGSTFPGVVQGGTGQSYTVRIYPQGLSGPASDVAVAAPGVADDAELPAGMAVAVSAVTKSDGTIAGYYIFPPVWL